MIGEAIAWVLGIASPVLVAIITFYFQRMQKKRDKKEEERTKLRRQEVRLMLDLQLATAKLSYATAMAIKRGSPNGEIEEGITEYEKALSEFRDFEREQLSRL